MQKKKKNSICFMKIIYLQFVFIDWKNITIINYVYVYNTVKTSKKDMIFDTILWDSFSQTNLLALFGQHILVG